jgi:Na+/melibiose symporter-like transporter
MNKLITFIIVCVILLIFSIFTYRNAKNIHRKAEENKSSKLKLNFLYYFKDKAYVMIIFLSFIIFVAILKLIYLITS